MPASIRVLYIGDVTAGSTSPPLTDRDPFDVVSTDSVAEGCAWLSTNATDCIVLSHRVVAEAANTALNRLWNAAPGCPRLLAPPPVVVEGEDAATTGDGDDLPPNHTMTLAERIHAVVNGTTTADRVTPTHDDTDTQIPNDHRHKPVDDDGTAHDDNSGAATPVPAYRSLIEDALAISSVGIFVLDDDFSVVWVNDGIEEYFGVDREEILGKDKRRLISTQLKHIFAEPDRFAETVCATYDDNTYAEQFTCHVVGDDSRDDRWLEHSSYPIPDGPYAGGRIEHYVDITEQRETQQRLEAQNERLAEFASIASHDLRNPLHVVGSSLELAEETGEAEHFERAERAVDRMEQLIDDLLVLATQGEEIDDAEAVSLETVARECWAHLSTESASLNVETARTFTADRSRLRQLLENLFRNSVDHADVAVTITVGDCDGGFFVADNGPGVPADDREAILERGYTTRREGTGLGLYIVSEIAAAHGWDVEVADSKTGGFRIEITGVE